MFLGHFAVALTAKKAAPKTSLGTLVLGAQFADMLWPVLLLAGIEKVRIAPGLLPASLLDFVSYPVSHSLIAQMGWGAALGAAYFLVRRDRRGAIVLGLLVPSHWILDFLAHRPDLPILPGWREIWSRVVELGAADNSGRVRDVRGRSGGVPRRHPKNGSSPKPGPVVVPGSAGRDVPCGPVWAAAPQRFGAGLERNRPLGYGAMGGVGRPATAATPGMTAGRFAEAIAGVW